jgi:hypothetical protein
MSDGSGNHRHHGSAGLERVGNFGTKIERGRREHGLTSSESRTNRIGIGVLDHCNRFTPLATSISSSGEDEDLDLDATIGIFLAPATNRLGRIP